MGVETEHMTYLPVIALLSALLLLVACSEPFEPESKVVIETQNRFLDDVASAEVATRIIRFCPGYRFNETEQQVVLDRFAKAVEDLPKRGGAPIAEVIAFQENAKNLMQSKSSKAYVGARAAQMIELGGVTPDAPDLICRMGEDEYQKKSQIGRFLIRTNP